MKTTREERKLRRYCLTSWRASVLGSKKMSAQYRRRSMLVPCKKLTPSIEERIYNCRNVSAFDDILETRLKTYVRLGETLDLLWVLDVGKGCSYIHCQYYDQSIQVTVLSGMNATEIPQLCHGSVMLFCHSDDSRDRSSNLKICNHFRAHG